MSASPRDYRCLTCNAEPGSPCKRLSGHAIPFGGFHAGREAMYEFHYPPEKTEEAEIPTGAGTVEYEGRLF